MKNTGLKTLLVDDHILLRKGIISILRDLPEIGEIVEVGSGSRAIAEAAGRSYDLVLLDVTMPEMDGIETLKQLKKEQPGLKVIMLTMHPAEQYAIQSLQAGASGYLCKDCSPEELIAAVREVMARGKYITPAVGLILADKVDNTRAGATCENLSQRELQVLRLLSSGFSIKEIAAQLYLSPKTVTTYKTRICQKLNLKNNIELIRFMIDHTL